MDAMHFIQVARSENLISAKVLPCETHQIAGGGKWRPK